MKKTSYAKYEKNLVVEIAIWTLIPYRAAFEAKSSLSKTKLEKRQFLSGVSKFLLMFRVHVH